MPMVIIKPPINIIKFGISFIPNKGNQAHKMPPTTSRRVKKAKSAEGKYFAPKLKSIKPKEIIKPCSMLKKKLISGIFNNDVNESSNIVIEKKEQSRPAIITTLNFGDLGFHLIETA